MKTSRILTILVLVLGLISSASAELVAHYEFEGNSTAPTGLDQGDVWSFTTVDYIVVDDMESYGDADTSGPPVPPGSRIWFSWRDGYGWANPTPANPGNGSCSVVDLGTSNVHNGNQSLMLFCDNDGGFYNALHQPVNVYYSKIGRTFDQPQDWTIANVKALTLYFYGDLGNDVSDPMWVMLTDQSNSSGRVTYGTYTDEDVSKLTAQAWNEWNIDLADFGVDLEHVTDISIGIGEPEAASPGGIGTVFFDDIRLYRPRCFVYRLKRASDLNNDCVVDYADLVILTEKWLSSGYLVTPQQPSANGLVAHYEFEGNADDSSGQGNHGTAYGNTYTIGKIGQAISFDGVDDYVELPLGPLISSLTESTFTIWVNFSDTGGLSQRFLYFNTNELIYMFLSLRSVPNGPMRFAITTDGVDGEFQVDYSGTLPDDWHHVAVVFGDEPDDPKIGYIPLSLYVDGIRVGVNTQSTLSPSSLGVTANNWLGGRWTDDPNDPYDYTYTGCLDDFRIYNRALPKGEVASLAGKTEPFSELFDLNVDGGVDLIDFALLSDSWLKELLWPQ